MSRSLASRLRSLWVTGSPQGLRDAETALLSMSGLPPSRMRRTSVALPSGRSINTLVAGPIDAPPVVLVHGYGAGLAYWWRNLAALAEQNRVYAIDLPGFGRSSREPLQPRADPDPGAEPAEADVDAAESYFVDAIAEWRERVGVDRFVLCAHSFGGMVAGVFAVRHPEAVAHLALVSPFGLPGQPTIRPELRADSRARVAVRTVERAWRGGITPNRVMSVLGPAGEAAVQWALSGRLRGLNDGERRAAAGYSYQLWAAEEAGEGALATLYHPFGWARRPLERRLLGVGTTVSFVYGAHDWMDSRPAERLALADPERFTGVSVVPGGGHNMFVESPGAFDSVIAATLERVGWR